MRIPMLALGVAVFAVVVSCSTATTSTSVGGVASPDSSKPLANLTADDTKWLCDWTNQQEGGYGAITPCDAARTDLEADKDQATCLAEMAQRWHFDAPSCTMTLGDWMTCMKWRLSNWCSASPPPATGTCAAIQAGCFGTSVRDAGGGE